MTIPSTPRFTIHHCAKDEISRPLAIRITVFVHEQKFTMEDELDGVDNEREHFLLIDHSLSPPLDVGTIRYNPAGKLERLAVLKSHRNGIGAGKMLVKGMHEYVMKNVRNENGKVVIKCHAQLHAVPFYEKQGYVKKGEEFMEDDQPHILMTCTIKLDPKAETTIPTS